MLHKLMVAIGREEQRQAEEHNAQLPLHSASRQTRVDSFWPLERPLHSSFAGLDKAEGNDDILPCHYFDFITGSSTGSYESMILHCVSLKLTIPGSLRSCSVDSV